MSLGQLESAGRLVFLSMRTSVTPSGLVKPCMSEYCGSLGARFRSEERQIDVVGAAGVGRAVGVLVDADVGDAFGLGEAVHVGVLRQLGGAVPIGGTPDRCRWGSWSRPGGWCSCRCGRR